MKKGVDNSFRIPLQGKLGAAFVTAQFPAGDTDTAIMEMVRYMLMKGMLVCSGMDSAKGHHFQIGAVDLAKKADTFSEAFEEYGACVAQTVVKRIGR